MLSQDHDQFARALLVLAEAIQIEIPDGYPELLWIVLQHSPWPVVERGLHQAMRRRWAAFPKPSEIGELIDMSMNREAERQWLQLQEAVRQVGPHHSITCEDPGLAEAIRIVFADWPTACRRLREAEGAERTMLRKEFLQAYPLAWERAPRSTNAYLQGLREIWHERGLNETLLPVFQVGLVDRPRPLGMIGGSRGEGGRLETAAEPVDLIPPEEAKALFAGLVKHLSIPAVFCRPSQWCLPPATAEEETPERLEEARQRREAQVQQAREAGLIE
jgi:hypothetical protein